MTPLPRIQATIGLIAVFGALSARGASIHPTGVLSCAGQVDGVVLPVPLECSQFYICQNNVEVQLDCGPDMHFDMRSKTCVLAAQSDCVPGQLRIVEKPRVPVIPQGICSGLSIGAFIPSKTDCRDFFLCVGSEPMVRSCPDGMHFNPDTRACIAEQLSQCVVGESELEGSHSELEKSQHKPAQPVLTTIVAESLCLGQANGVMVPAPGSCSKYYTCLQHEALQHSCGFRHFDPLRRVCIEAADSSCVEGQTSGDLSAIIKIDEQPKKVIKLPVAKETPVQSERLPIGITEFEKDKNTNTKPNGFIVSGGKLVGNNKLIPIRKPGLPVIKNPLPLPDTSIPVGSIESDDNSESVGDSESGQNANANKAGSLLLEKKDQIEKLLKLKKPEEVAKVPNDEVKKEEKDNREVVLAVVNKSEANSCDGVLSGTLFPRAGNCREFLTCEAGEAFVGECPHGLHFNAVAKFCDWPELAGCA